MSRSYRPSHPLFRLMAIVGIYGLPHSTPVSSGAGPRGAPPPNVVLIVADDLGWSDLGCYGSDLHETPNLDRLAERGIRFTNAYAASPVCTPTRSSLLTGRHPARLQMTIWREAASDRGTRRLLEPIVRPDLPRSETTLAEIFQAAGYYTAHVGKWHLGSAEFYPQSHGFDVNVGGTLWGAPQSFFFPFRGDHYFSDWRYVPDLEPSRLGDYLTDRLTDKALEIVDRVADRPFYLNLWYHSVHTPIEGKPDLIAKYRAKRAALSEAQANPNPVHTNPHYAAMVDALDANIGRLIAKLDELKIADSTIVLFLSDNGGVVDPCRLHPEEGPVTNNAPLRSGKGSLYEGGVRVPLIARIPRVAQENCVCDAPVYTCDLFPTLVKLTEVAPLALGDVVLDGVDIGDLLHNPSGQIPDRDIFFHYPHYYSTTTPVSAIRSGDWKLLEYLEDGRIELYNLADDVGEQRELSTKETNRSRALRDKLQAWRRSVNAPMPETNNARGVLQH